MCGKIENKSKEYEKFELSDTKFNRLNIFNIKKLATPKNLVKMSVLLIFMIMFSCLKLPFDYKVC